MTSKPQTKTMSLQEFENLFFEQVMEHFGDSEAFKVFYMLESLPTQDDPFGKIEVRSLLWSMRDDEAQAALAAAVELSPNYRPKHTDGTIAMPRFIKKGTAAPESAPEVAANGV